MSGKEAKYEVTVETGFAYSGSGGSRNFVDIQLIGEGAVSTDWIELDNKFEREFRRGDIDVFKFKAADIGIPVVAKLRIRKGTWLGQHDTWYVRDIIIKYKDEKTHFPIHDWITDEFWVTRGEALLPHNVGSRVVSTMQSREVEQSKANLQWIPHPGPNDLGWGLPRYINVNSFDDIPLILTHTEARSTHHNMKTMKAIVSSGLAAIEMSLKSGLNDLESYKDLYGYLEFGNSIQDMDRWKTDEEFGRQQMNGLSPLSYAKCWRLPDECRINDNDVVKQLNGKSLLREIQEGTIFIADYSRSFQGVPRNKNKDGEQLYCPDAICLYHVNRRRDFVPIAIQLVPNDPETIFTPNDSAEDWLLAKMYFKVAFGNMHQWYYHFLLTHGITEPISVSLFRCFPRSHPIYKLLRPHLQNVTAINQLARDILIYRESLTNQALGIVGEDMARQGYKTFTMDDLVIPKVLAKKGLTNKNSLPNYYYRDDALELWEIMEKFVENMIRVYYKSDEDVQKDDNLQDFVKDIVQEGLGWADGSARGVPFPIKSVEDLVRFCVSVMFTCSAQHAATNFQQYEVYKFIPSAPLAMRLPPHKKGEATMQRIMDSLPNVHMATVAIVFGYILSVYSPNETYIGDYPTKLFTDFAALQAMDDYKNKLEVYSKKIKQRNSQIQYPYIWLLPEKVPNSIAA